MLALTKGRKTQSHPKGPIPERYVGAELELVVVGDLEKFLAGEQGGHFAFRDRTATYENGLPFGAFFVDEVLPREELEQKARELVAAPVRLVDTDGGTVATSRGMLLLTRVGYMGGGRQPDMPDAVLKRLLEQFVAAIK